MKERKLRSVYWQGALNKKCVKQVGRKTVVTCITLFYVILMAS
jgi:hypothetical protein